MRFRLTIVVWTVLALGAVAMPRESAARNILVVIVDDVGVDLLGAYHEVKPGMDEPPEHAITPNISDLAQHGLLFRNAWSAPLCSATRATMLSGQYGFRTGVGDANSFLADAVPTVAGRLAIVTPTRIAIGKWHVTNYDPQVPDTVSPMNSGFQEYRGSPRNLTNESYFAWVGSTDAPPAPASSTFFTDYVTTWEVDEAIAFLHRPPPEPWFLWLGLHALHTPLEAPPEALHTQADVKTNCEPGAPPGCASSRAITRAMLEATDTELGRLFSALDLNDTTVILVGDNGTLNPLDTAIHRANKGTIYEGGINVPLMIAGDAVPASVQGRETAALAHTVDLLPTILALAGVPNSSSVDGKSLVPVLGNPSNAVRRFAYTDGTFPTTATANPRRHDVAIRDARYKLVRAKCASDGTNPRRLYDLGIDPGEENDIYPGPTGSEAETARLALEAELRAITGPDVAPCTPPPVPPIRCGIGSELALLLAVLMGSLLHARRSQSIARPGRSRESAWRPEAIARADPGTSDREPHVAN